MNGIYKLKNKWIYFSHSFALITTIACALICYYYTDTFAHIIGTALLLCGLFVSYQAQVYKVIINDVQITVHDVFSSNTIYLSQIASFNYNVNKKYAYILYPVNPLSKTVEISIFIENDLEIKAFLEHNFQNQEYLDTIELNTQIINSDYFGKDIYEKEFNINKTKSIAWTLNIVTTCLFLWIGVFPKPYILTLSISIFWVWIVLFIIKTNNGRFLFFVDDSHVEAEKYSLDYPLYMGLLLPLTRYLLDWNVDEYPLFLWISTFSISILILVIILNIINTNTEFNWGNAFLWVLVWLPTFGYVFSSTIHINCFNDLSKPTYCKGIILDKKFKNQKGFVNYEITVKTETQPSITDDYDITQTMYKQNNISDTVWVVKKRGNLGIVWIDIKNYKTIK